MRCVISGQVQGVWFRASTQQRAQSLGINGSAKNLLNGDVEVIACGEEQALSELREWLWQGPQFAKVGDVRCETVTLDSVLSRFITG